MCHINVLKEDNVRRGFFERRPCPGRLLHDCRRTAVRNLEGAGVSRSVGMSLTGHKTEAVFRRYAIVDSAVQAEAPPPCWTPTRAQHGTVLGTVTSRRIARRA